MIPPKKSPQAPLSEAAALSRAASLCSRSEQCESQIRQKLERWQVEPETRERIIARLVEERFIDEERFAAAYARDKFRYNHWGPARIDMQLRLLGIADAHRRSALSLLSEENRTLVLRQLLQAKTPTVKARNEYERRGKLIRFAMGKGFSMDDIVACLDNINKC